MYNDEIKQRFLESPDGVKIANHAKAFFVGAQKEEERIKLDVSQMSVDDQIRLLNSFDFSSMQTARTYINVLRHYSEWAIKNREFDNVAECVLNARDHYDFVDALRRTCYSSFSDIVSDVTNYYDFNVGDEALPSLCFAWIGVEKKDVAYIRMSDVDLENSCVFYDGIFMKLEPMIIKVLKQYQDSHNSTRKQNYTTHEVYKLKSDYFMQKMVTKNSTKTPGPINGNQITIKIQALRDLLPIGNPSYSKLSYINVFKSGGYYRIYQMEKQGLSIDVKHEKEIKKAFRGGGIQISDILFQYQCYKKAFELE